MGVPSYSSENLVSTDGSHFSSSFLWIQILLPYTRLGRASALHTFILENFWTKVRLKVLFRIPII